MRKSMKQILSFAMAVILLVLFSNSVIVKASNTVDKNGNSVADMQIGNFCYCFGGNIKIGNEIYYSINRYPCEKGIYKINKKGTKTKLVLKKQGKISHMSHYGKWLYFIWDKEALENDCSLTENSWLCKVKCDGTGFKKICRSNSCMIRNDRLYYQKTKYAYDQWGELKSDIDTGKIGTLNLKTGKRSTFQGSEMHLKAVEKNKIYYYTDNNILYSMDANGKNRKKLIKDNDIFSKIIYNHCLYWNKGNKLYKKSLKTKETKKMCTIKNLSKGRIVDIKKDRVYVVAGNYRKENLYKVSIKSRKKKCIMKSCGFSCKIYGNVIVGGRHLAKEYKDKNNRMYNSELYSYNLKMKKRVRLLVWFEQ